MEKIRYHIIVLSVCLLSSSIYSQTNTNVIKEICNRYTNSSPIQLNTMYRLYEDHKTKKVSEFYTGAYLKNSNKEIYAKVGNTEYFVVDNLITQISHDESVIIVSSNNNAPAEFDLNKLLEDFSVSKVTDMNKYWKLELDVKQISNYPYSKIIIEAGKDYLITKQVFYYNSGVNFSNDYTVPDIKYPRLEITYNKPAKAISKSFKMSTYYVVSNTGISTSKAFKGYKIFDNRKHNN